LLDWKFAFVAAMTARNDNFTSGRDFGLPTPRASPKSNTISMRHGGAALLVLNLAPILQAGHARPGIYRNPAFRS
jgi:hypothetical protein